MSTARDVLTAVYKAVNDRDIERALATMHPDVDWPNGMEGGYVHGQEAVGVATPGTGVVCPSLPKGTSPKGIVVSSREKTDVAVRAIAPGGSTGWHYHDGQVIAVGKSGTLTRTLQDCSTEVTSSGGSS